MFVTIPFQEADSETTEDVWNDIHQMREAAVEQAGRAQIACRVSYNEQIAAINEDHSHWRYWKNTHTAADVRPPTTLQFCL